MKIVRATLAVLIISMLLSGCALIEDDKTQETSKAKIVSVEEVKVENKPNQLYYYATAMPQKIVKLSLKTGGIIEKILVEKGQSVEELDLLMSLDKSQLDLALSSSYQDLNAAKLDYEKAVESYEFYSSIYYDTTELYESGAVSKSELDQITLQKDISEKEVEQAQSIYNQAISGYDNSVIQNSDADLFSNIKGIVVDTLYQEGELYPPGYPAVIVRSNFQSVKLGITEEDLKKIELDTKVSVKSSDRTYKAYINNINPIPDEYTRTYEVELFIDEEANLLIGESVDVYFELGDIEGIWININTLSSDGMDYVYIVEDQRVVRKNISIHEIYEDLVRVEGLEAGDLLIVEGGKNLKIGYEVFLEGEKVE